MAGSVPGCLRCPLWLLPSCFGHRIAPDLPGQLRMDEAIGSDQVVRQGGLAMVHVCQHANVADAVLQAAAAGGGAVDGGKGKQARREGMLSKGLHSGAPDVHCVPMPGSQQGRAFCDERAGPAWLAAVEPPPAVAASAGNSALTVCCCRSEMSSTPTFILLAHF